MRGSYPKFRIAVTCIGLLFANATFAQDKIAVSYTPGTPFAPLFLATDLGYFSEENLNVDPVRTTSVTETFVALASGKLDMMFSGVNAAHFNLVSRGLDARIVAALGIQPPMTTIPLMVRKALWEDRSIRSGADLRGKKIVILSPGNASEIKIVTVLANNGMSLNDVELSYMQYPLMGLAFKNSAIDAAVPSEPFATFLRRDGSAVNLVEESKIGGGELTTTLLISGKFIQEHRDAGVRFIRAMQRTVPLLSGDRWREPKTLAILAKWTGNKPADIAEGEFSIFDPDLNPQKYLPSIQRQEKAHLANKRLQYDQPLDPHQYLDPSLAVEARTR